jgi:inhibitor of the pro-sigma K processing machinery
MNYYIFLIPILSAVILIISLLAKKMEWFLNFATRLCIGGVVLYLTSIVCSQASLPCHVGINTTTLATVGLLGVPGFLLIVSIETLSSIK